MVDWQFGAKHFGFTIVVGSKGWIEKERGLTGGGVNKYKIKSELERFGKIAAVLVPAVAKRAGRVL